MLTRLAVSDTSHMFFIPLICSLYLTRVPYISHQKKKQNEKKITKKKTLSGFPMCSLVAPTSHRYPSEWQYSEDAKLRRSISLSLSLNNEYMQWSPRLTGGSCLSISNCSLHCYRHPSEWQKLKTTNYASPYGSYRKLKLLT